MKSIFKTSVRAITSREGVLNTYLQDVARLSTVLSIDEEKEYGKRILENHDTFAINKLVTANLRFAISIAKSYEYTGLDLLDLIQEGNKGLMIAAEKFDYTKGFKFISYAVWYIKRSLNEFVQEHGLLVRIPTNLVANKGKVIRFVNKYLAKNGVEPSYDIIAEGTGLDLADVLNVYAADKTQVSLDTPLDHDDEEGRTLENNIKGNDEDADHIVEKESLSIDLNDTINKTLSKRDADIIINLFGLNGKHLNEDELANKYHLTKVRILQIKRDALVALQSHKDELKAYLAA